MTVTELMEKRRKVWETAKSFVDTHQNENGVLSAEDTETYGRMEAEIQELTDAINRQTKMERLDKELSKPVNEPIREQPGSGTAEKKTGRIDFNAGGVLEGKSFEEVEKELFHEMLEVASGRHHTKNEEYGYREISIFRDGVTL